MNDIGVEFAPEHAYGRAFFEGVADFAAQHRNWHLCPISQDISKSAIQNLDGLIMRLFGDRVERTAKSLNIPIVDIYCEKPRSGIGQVHGDYGAFAELAANLYLSRGFTNFGWCGINDFSSKLIENEFAARISAAGFTCSSYTPPTSIKGVIVCSSPDWIPDAKSLRKWLLSLPKPIGLFCFNDHRAYQVLQMASEIGLRIPEEVSILSNDNDTTICALASTPISSIDPDARRVGYVAARMLSAIMSGDVSSKSHRQFLVPPKDIIERKSTEHIPIDPPWLSTALLTIEKELSNGISSGDICRMSGLSAPTVEKTFRKKLGTPIVAYITEARMRKAKSLLQNSNLLTKQIAATCGYKSPQYFCRVFQSHYGISPQAFRDTPSKKEKGARICPRF